MPWHPCVNSRDSITADAGGALPNGLEGGLRIPNVTSSCRDANGTWIAWIENASGSFADGTYTGNDFPVKIGFFPDDGSAAQFYELPVNYAWSWNHVPAFGAQPCSIEFPFDPGKFDMNLRNDLTGWSTDVLDVQIRSDGARVWVVILAAESVMYPYITGGPHTDRCGIFHVPIIDVALGEGLSPGEDGNVFEHDTTGLGHGTFWMQYGTGSRSVGGWDDDAGPDNSFRWQPARVTVYGGDIGGFTKLGTVEAQYENLSGNPGKGIGLCSGIECAASPAEPGVLHVMWAEGGSWDYYGTQLGQRITYSTWGFDAKLSETELASTSELFPLPPPLQANGYLQGKWCWTAEMIVRNDHGSPCAIVLPWNITSQDAFGVQGSPSAPEYWDLSTGAVVQTMDDSLLITGAEAGYPDPMLPRGRIINSTIVGSPAGYYRSHFASSLYTDPTLANRDVYLVAVTFFSGGLETDAGGAPDSTDRPVAFYRIPCDGSDNFDFMDGTRLVAYSIIPQKALAPQGDVFDGNDFVSDPGNVWMPTQSGLVLHLPRTCERTWEVLDGFPTPTPDGAVRSISWELGPTSPPTIYTDSSGGDWLVAGGSVAVAPGDLVGNPSIAALRAKICRCCVPCGGSGVHAWHRI